MARVSVLIPTYNRADLVMRAVDSALAQTFRDVEIIVIDDGSTDETQQLFELPPEKVRYISRPHSGLPAAARNTGLEFANGEYVALLDSDDEWLPEKLERQVRVLDDVPEVGLTCSNAFVAGKDGLRYLGDRPSARGMLFGELLEENFVIGSTAVFRRDLLAETGSFCESPMFKVGEDYDLWLRMAALAHVSYEADPLAVYRDAPDTGIRWQQPVTEIFQAELEITKRSLAFASARRKLQPEILHRARRTKRLRRNRLVRLLVNERHYLRAARALMG